MRMRKKPNLGPRMEACSSWLIDAPEDFKGRWKEEVTHGLPLHLEIGCGKGRFAVGTAVNEPEHFVVGLELVPDALVMAMEKAASENVNNVKFIHGNAIECLSFFDRGEVDRIYLNFSDPWPSNRHMKRRLTSQNFLEVYKKILSPGGELFQKTDNLPFFEYSLMRFTKDGWDVSSVTRDLHSTGGGGVMTEYEEKFSSMGAKICRLEARPPKSAE